MKFKVGITIKTYERTQLPLMLAKHGAQLITRVCRTQEDLIEHFADADAIMTTSAPFTRKVFGRLKHCRGVVRIGVGMDNFDIPAATEQGVLLANTTSFYIEDVANHTIAFILACSRNLLEVDSAVRAGKWSLDLVTLRRLSLQTIGIIGFGEIAENMVPKLKAFGPRIIVYHPRRTPEQIASFGCEAADLDRVIRDSDFLVLLCPLNEETKNLIDKKAMKAMKKSAFLINTARAGIVNEVDLHQALSEKWIAGAAVDVFSVEPPPPNHPLLGLKNTLVSPHIGWFSEDSRNEAAVKASEEVIRILRGERPINLINPEVFRIHGKPGCGRRAAPAKP